MVAVSVTTSVPTTPLMVILPSLSVKYRPLLLICPFSSGTNSPVEVVTLKVTPSSGSPVRESRLSMTSVPALEFFTMTVWVSPPSPMTTLVEGVSMTYPPSGALISVSTYAPGARLVILISPWASVVKMPFWVRVLSPITPSSPTSQPAAVVTRNSAPGRGWPVALSRFWIMRAPFG